MGLFIVRHKVKDFGKWRPVFDDDEERRKAAGLSNPRVYRSTEDPNEVVAMFDCADLGRTKQFFAADPKMKEAMEASGVIDQPTVYFLNEA